MTGEDTREREISPPLMPDTRDAVRARQGVVSFRVVTVLAVSFALAALALGLTYVLA